MQTKQPRMTPSCFRNVRSATEHRVISPRGSFRRYDNDFEEVKLQVVPKEFRSLRAVHGSKMTTYGYCAVAVAQVSLQRR